jgi:cellulose biosynthesis protein BcsQ
LRHAAGHQCKLVCAPGAGGLAESLTSNLQGETASSHGELIGKVQQHGDADYVMLDGPRRIAELTRAILILADLSLIPVGASMAESWARPATSCR